MATFASYIDDFRILGREGFRARHGAPVLIRQDADFGTFVDDEEQGYNTGVFSERSLRDTLDSVPIPDALSEASEQVYRIAKRAGGAFAERVGVGRARNVDVSIPLSRVSKYHAFVTEDEGGGGYFLTDAGSKNRTFVDGKELVERRAAALRNGSVVQLGPYRFDFYTPDGFCALVRQRAAAR